MKGVTMRKAMLAVLLALGGLAAPSLAEGLPPICARGAVSGPLPMAHLIQLEMTDYLVMHGGRVDFDAFAPEDLDDTEAVMAAYTLAAAIEWPGVLADRAAELPKAAHDLPWLVLLASVDSTHGDPVWTLTQGAESILSPDLLPVMERHGLTEEARVLRTAMALFPDWETLPYDTFSPHQDLISERLATLWRIHSGDVDVVLLPATTALTRLAPPSFLAGTTFHFKQKARLDESRLKSQLTLAGYQHVSQVVSPGEYAVRGGLIDLFPMGSPVPYRVDLFGDEVDSIRTFDPDSQRSLYPVPEVRLLPCLLYTSDAADE